MSDNIDLVKEWQHNQGLRYAFIEEQKQDQRCQIDFTNKQEQDQGSNIDSYKSTILFLYF